MHIEFEGDFYTEAPHTIPVIGDVFRQNSGVIVRAGSLSHLSVLVNSGAELLVKLTKSQKISAQAELLRHLPKEKDNSIKNTFKQLAHQ